MSRSRLSVMCVLRSYCLGIIMLIAMSLLTENRWKISPKKKTSEIFCTTALMSQSTVKQKNLTRSRMQNTISLHLVSLFTQLSGDFNFDWLLFKIFAIYCEKKKHFWECRKWKGNVHDENVRNIKQKKNTSGKLIEITAH